MDLTLSSDAEPEPAPAPPVVVEDPSRRKAFRKYDLMSDDDEDFEGSPGWVPKRGSTVTNPPRRQTSVGLSNSSQTILNARNRRQTTE